MSKGKFALGALIGTAAGIVAGLLTAPRSGKETRADIKGKAAELKKQAVKRTNDAAQRSEDLAENIKSKVK